MSAVRLRAAMRNALARMVRRPRRLMWFLKATVLPRFYWFGVLKGREWFMGIRRD